MAKFNTLEDGTEFIRNEQRYRKNRLWQTDKWLSNATRRADTVEEINAFTEQGTIYEFVQPDEEVTIFVDLPSFALN